jgi:hypothetical protein
MRRIPSPSARGKGNPSDPARSEAALRCEASGGWRVGQGSTGGGFRTSRGCRFGTRLRGPVGKWAIACGGAISRSRRRLPRDALVEFGLGCGLAEEVPVRHEFGGIVPGGRASGGCDQRWLGGLSDVGKDVPNGSARSCACPLPVSLRPAPFSTAMSLPGIIRSIRIVSASVRKARRPAAGATRLGGSSWSAAVFTRTQKVLA